MTSSHENNNKKTSELLDLKKLLHVTIQILFSYYVSSKGYETQLCMYFTDKGHKTSFFVILLIFVILQ